jgi:mycothiol system anti-sigma-R factor
VGPQGGCVVVSHDEPVGVGDSADDAVECASVLAEVWTFLDGECTDETLARLCRHLEVCESCLHHYALEGRIKKLIATKCGGDKAPERFRRRP